MAVVLGGQSEALTERFRCDACGRETEVPMPVEILLAALDGDAELRTVHGCSAACVPKLSSSVAMCVLELGDCEIEMRVEGDSVIEVMSLLSQELRN